MSLQYYIIKGPIMKKSYQCLPSSTFYLAESLEVVKLCRQCSLLPHIRQCCDMFCSFQSLYICLPAKIIQSYFLRLVLP